VQPVGVGAGVGVGLGAGVGLGVGVGVGDVDTPDPERLITCGEFDALSFNVKTPVLVPVALGVKTTLAVQLAAGAREVWQVPSPPKLKSPLIVKSPLKDNVAVPELVTVTNCTALVDPTS
jgi:hypothetical protein